MTEHLLLISIGPIQDFIASARRCQDLWFGSWLLSDLARTVAKIVGEKGGGDPLIFPAGLKLDDKPAVANKILAILSQEKNPQVVADAAREAMEKRLLDLADIAFDPLPETYFNQTLAETQLKDLMEFLWVSVSLTNEPSAYAEARDRAEALLAARKNTKNWGPVSWHKLAGVGVPKSSLDGIRESVINETAYDKLTPEQLHKQYLLKPGERLCGVGLLKRAGTVEDRDMKGFNRPAFHSTSHIASASILTRMAVMGTNGKTAFQQYLKELKTLGVDVDRFRIRVGNQTHAEVHNPLEQDADALEPNRVFGFDDKNGGYDGYILFEGRLRELLTEYCSAHKGKAKKEVDVEPNEAELKKAKSSLAQFRKTLGLREGHTTYYAYLLADGDRMGKAIDVLSKLEDGVDQHRQLGTKLEEFSKSCAEIVEKAGGSLVYAGGDDVLALCPLHTALSLARQLRDEFSEKLGYLEKQATELKKHDEAFEVPTLSVGLAICHHMVSMERARELAKIAEKKAKDAGRNALAIVLEKRSGGTLELVSQWNKGDECLDRRLIQLAKWLKDERLPHGFAYDLEQILSPFLVPGDTEVRADVITPVIIPLAKRVLDRKRANRGESALDEEVADYLEKRLEMEAPMQTVTELASEIMVAREFLRSFEDAYEVPETKGGVQ